MRQTNNLSDTFAKFIENYLQNQYKITIEASGDYNENDFQILSLKKCLQREEIELREKSAVVLGAGKIAGRIAEFCLQEGAAEVYIINRTPLRGEVLAEELNRKFKGGKAKPLSVENYNALPEKKYIMFHCTSMGAEKEEMGAVIEDLDFYKKIRWGIDLVYQQMDTRFMQHARSVGSPVTGGLRMYMYGIIYMFEKQYGVAVSDVAADVLYTALTKEFGYEEE